MNIVEESTYTTEYLLGGIYVGFSISYPMPEGFDILNKDLPHQRFFLFVMLKEETGEGWGREIDGVGRRHGERRGEREAGTEGGQIEYRCYSGSIA